MKGKLGHLTLEKHLAMGSYEATNQIVCGKDIDGLKRAYR